MKVLLVLAFVFAPASLIADVTGGGGIDVGQMLVSYGVAAPFAGLCFLQMSAAQRRLNEKDNQIAALQQAAVDREKDFAMRLAPLLYDGARLYQAGNERLTQGLKHATSDSEIAQLKENVEELLRRLGEVDR